MDTLWYQEPQVRQELLSSLSCKLDELDLKIRSHGFDESQDMVTLPQQSVVRREVARQDKHTCSNFIVNDGEFTDIKVPEGPR